MAVRSLGPGFFTWPVLLTPQGDWLSYYLLTKLLSPEPSSLSEGSVVYYPCPFAPGWPQEAFNTGLLSEDNGQLASVKHADWQAFETPKNPSAQDQLPYGVFATMPQYVYMIHFGEQPFWAHECKAMASNHRELCQGLCQRELQEMWLQKGKRT